MLAYKTFYQCPVDQRPQGVNLSSPWQQQRILNSEAASFSQDGWVVVPEYSDIQTVNVSNSVEVIPCTPKNEQTLINYGVKHKHINSSTQIFDITLSNKSDKTYSFEGTQTPERYNCIMQDHSETRDGIASVDGSLITTYYGEVAEGSAKLVKPVNLDYWISNNTYQSINLWGCYFSASDFGDDDLVRMQVMDLDGVGVSLGWYTQAEFDYLGEHTLREYDECWVNQANKIGKIITPDGAPGELPTGLYLRAKYYPKDESKTNIKIWMDYIISVRD